MSFAIRTLVEFGLAALENVRPPARVRGSVAFSHGSSTVK